VNTVIMYIAIDERLAYFYITAVIVVIVVKRKQNITTDLLNYSFINIIINIITDH